MTCHKHSYSYSTNYSMYKSCKHRITIIILSHSV